MAKKPRPPGSKTKLRLFLESNVGTIVTSEQLQAVAGSSEWARRLRELRNEDGMQILSHNDRAALRPNEYLLETLDRKPTIHRSISSKVRHAILERDGSTCQACGAAAGEESLCEPGKKCRLQVDHITPVSQGGSNEASNLRSVCVYYNKHKSNLKAPTPPEVTYALTLIRKQCRDVQFTIYQFLETKFKTIRPHPKPWDDK